MMVLRLEHLGRPILVRVEHAALLVGDRVEVAGQQITRDGMPQGRVWLAVDVHDLLAAVVGQAEICRLPDSGTWQGTPDIDSMQYGARP